ncbi:T9SS type A sorting domain-containing protein [Flavobacterium soyae]|uniref:T9SS type A sorting domain-containing protein n=1 Tax=Flavobacterium soyae TaxID=2903098 RepID=A0ABZ2UCE2_9FLAO
MKKIYLLIILLFSILGYSQGVGNYKVSLGITGINQKVSISANCGSRLESWLNYSNAGEDHFFNQPVGDGQDLPRNWTATFPSSKKLTRIRYYSSGMKWHGGFTSRCKNDNSSTEYKNVSYGITEYYLPNYFTRIYNLRATLKILPDLHIQVPTPNNGGDILPTTDKITIKSNTGFLSSEYNWQYSTNPLDPSSWISLPQFNTASITVNAVDILQVLDASSHGKKISFRQIAYNGAAVSNEVTYSVRLSAPRVDSASPIDPTCSDTNDGSIKLMFNRTLYPGEQLNYTLLDVTTNTPTDYNGTLAIEEDKSFVISGLRKGSYMLQLVGFKDGLSTSTDADRYDLKSFIITPPPPVDFTLSSTNVQCYGSQDGTITITPTGGTRSTLGNDSYSLDNGVSWIPFPNDKPYTITGLAPGTYRVKVKDMNGCIAKTQTLVNGNIQLGDDKVLEETLSQPTSPLTLHYTFKKDPTFYGAANGKLTASITGGTINDDKSYEYEWKNSNGVVLPAAAQYNSADKTFNITLEDIPEGEYKLTVKDKNYNNVTNKAGCSIIESTQVLSQPDQIKIVLTETQSISCNSENLESDRNKFSDGIIKAAVSGGIKFTGAANNGLPYKYIWSKYNAVTNLWEELTDYKTDTAENLSKGNYSLNVIDANGIVQGTYNITDLVTAIPTTKEIAEPTKLELSFTSGNVSCHQGNNGWATATVTGGAGSYKYKWYNTGGGFIDENKISQLTAGEYTVEVTDGKGCFIKGSIIISEPAEIVKIDYEEIFTPTFSGATNGRITAKITGGTSNADKSYNYEWKNSKGILQAATAEVKDGIYTITLNGVPADDYFLTIKDKNYNEATNQIINCSVLESKVTLNEPDPLKVIFEIVRTISCNTSNEFGNDTDTTPKDGQRDESQDGILTAHVSGGTPLASSVNNGLPYYFYWKKQQPDGSWTALPNITGETASDLSHGNYALNVKDRNGIMLGTYVNNQLTQEIDAAQLMQEPAKLSVTITHGDVFCNEGNDGWATANVVGGTPPYDYKWSNEVEIDKNTVLKSGEYWVFITDAKGCTAQESVTILQPVTPLTINYKEVLNPGFYKATNGKIVVEVTGGTIFSDNTYWFEWKNSKGIVQTTTTTNFSNGVYTISLNGLPEEMYSLTVRDANYNPAANKTSCTVVNSVTTLDDPDPLEVTFEVVRTISCNVSNEFGNETDANPSDNQRDESQDGILVAHVKGGIQLQADKNKGLPYFYTWKKQQKDGSWILWNDQDETAENLSEGTYGLNIEDANGIKLGTYVNNVLVGEKDVTHYMPEPEKLKLSFTKFDVGCTTGNDGWAEAHVSGGTPPYTYEWTNGGTTPKIENISTNNYFVIATDAKGCIVQGSIFVGDPKGIFTTETIKNPICYKGNDGSIQLNVTGGNLPYSYLWNTGATTKDLNNLTAGNYEVAIICPDCCTYKKKFVLKDPGPVIVNIGTDRTLCNDQNLDLDAAVADQKAQYSWTSTNGFTSNDAKINVSKAGTYHVKVTSGLGCIGEDEVVIKTSQAVISSEFLLSSQAYLDEEVILINTSNPFGENTNWVIPKGVKIVEQKEKYITLKFDAIGVYSIGLQQTQGECYATYTKNITIEQRSTLPNTGTTSQFIVDFIVTPNPSNGNFKALVTLENNSDINLRLFSTTGQNTMIQKKESGKKKYEIDFDTALESGMYVLVLETGQQTLVKKIIIY